MGRPRHRRGAENRPRTYASSNASEGASQKLDRNWRIQSGSPVRWRIQRTKFCGGRTMGYAALSADIRQSLEVSDDNWRKCRNSDRFSATPPVPPVAYRKGEWRTGGAILTRTHRQHYALLPALAQRAPASERVT